MAHAASSSDQQAHIQNTSTAVLRRRGSQGRARGRQQGSRAGPPARPAATDSSPAFSVAAAGRDSPSEPRRYELHHGVRINDGALVEAAVMSDRYIADRFLPDKAIDLVDEAAAKLKMEITSKPVHLDEIDRKVLQLEMERLSLTKARAARRPPAPPAAAADAVGHLSKPVITVRSSPKGSSSEVRHARRKLETVRRRRCARADPAAAAAQAHDRAAQARLRALDDTLARLKAEQAELTTQWQREKEEMRRLQSIKNEIDRVNLDIQARAHPRAPRARRGDAPPAVISACLAHVTRAPVRALLVPLHAMRRPRYDDCQNDMLDLGASDARVPLTPVYEETFAGYCRSRRLLAVHAEGRPSGGSARRAASPERPAAAQTAERDYDLNRAAELKYGTLLQLQRQLKEAEEELAAKVRRPRAPPPAPLLAARRRRMLGPHACCGGCLPYMLAVAHARPTCLPPHHMLGRSAGPAARRRARRL